MAQQLKEIYEEKYRGKIGQKRHLAIWHQETLKTLTTFDRDQKVLEIGCGNGRLLAPIAELGFDALGIDVASEAVEQCQERGLNARQVDISQGIPYREQFDICISVEVIEHVFDPYHFLAQANRSLKSTGIAIITTPNFGYYRWRWQYLRGISPSEIQNPFHIRFFTAPYLSEIVRLQGFEVLRMYSPVQSFQWAENAFRKLGLGSQWETLTRRWGKTLFTILKKRTPPQYEDLIQVTRKRNE
ncbi:MAG: class I SAM-dependent methyltransferase [Anaerolineae bacterium]